MPRNDKFFDLFEAQTEKLKQASVLLQELGIHPDQIGNISSRLSQLEKEADNVGYQIIDGLHRSFITPIDRSDIDLLRQNLDDIMDGIEKAINRIFIYNIIFNSDSIGKYLQIVEEEISEIDQGVKEIKNLGKFSKDLIKHCHRINILEDKGDVVNRSALKTLLNPKDISCSGLLEIVKKKEVYDILEGVIDRCEDVGNVLESILIKNL